MSDSLIPLVMGAIILAASLVSLKLGLSVAIIEMLFGALGGSIGLHVQDWMAYLSGFGGITLTFLAGTEVDTTLLKEKFKESFLIGFFSFLAPFVVVAGYTYFVAHWGLRASLLAGTALSCTSLAVVYSVLVETGMGSTQVGKLLMASTFVTDMGTALALSILFVKPTLYSLVFILISIIVIVFATKFSHLVFDSPRLKNKVVEPEIKYLFLLLLAFMYFAQLGEGQAVMPAFILGLLMSPHFRETAGTKSVRDKLRTVAYAIITPVFFIVGGMNVSFPVVLSALALFLILLGLKLAGKFVGVFFLSKRFIPRGAMYTTLLMSTGLTFGTIAAVFGLNAGIINQVQYSLLVGVIIASAAIPTFIAQKWFAPRHSEDIVELNENGR